MLCPTNNGSNFRIYDKLETFSGEGKLIGEAWKWTGWEYTVAMKDGSGRLTGKDTLTRDTLLVKKTFFSPDGTPRVKFSEKLNLISQSMYLILKSNLVPQ